MSLTSKIRETINMLPSNHDPYTTLKSAILKTVASHPDDNLLKLLNDTPLGSSRPSDLLSQLKLLTQQFPSAVQDSILRPVFLSKLPSTAQAMLAVAPTASLSDLAGIADKMLQHLPNLQAHAVAAPPARIDTYSSPTPQNFIIEELRALRDCIQRLEQSVHDLKKESASQKAEIKALRHQHFPRSHTPPRPSRSTTPNPHNSYPPLNTQGICYYHEKFKEKALKCHPGCIMSGNLIGGAPPLPQ